MAKQALGQQSRLLVGRPASSGPALPPHKSCIAALPTTRGRRGTAGVATGTPAEKRGLLPAAAILPTPRNGTPGSLGLLSKTHPLSLPLLQQKGALPPLPTLLRSLGSPPGTDPEAGHMQEEGTQQPPLSCSAEILKEYLWPFTPLSVSVVGDTSFLFCSLLGTNPTILSPWKHALDYST